MTQIELHRVKPTAETPDGSGGVGTTVNIGLSSEPQGLAALKGRRPGR